MGKEEYVIDLQGAEEFRDYIASILNVIYLQVKRNYEKDHLWEIRHSKLPNYQLGALELCGDKDSIKQFDAVKYIELRFEIKHLKKLNKYEFVDKIDKSEKKYRDDSETLLRFRFYEINYETVNDILKKLNCALWIMNEDNELEMMFM